MKVFDAHCHIYPAKIARKAAQTTAAFYDYTGETLDGTVQTLFAHGDGITKFLVQSVATRPDQVQHINEFIAREVAQFPDRLYGFGALHPDSPTLEEDIAHLRALGLHGVKLHPDIQGFRLDDPRCFALAEQCEGVLPLLLHTGDSRYDFSNPNRLIPLLRRFPRLTVIGAHFGGYTIWQEAARQLAGRFENLWVDCSSSFFAMDVAAGRALIDAPERFEERAHRRVGCVDRTPAFSGEPARDSVEVDIAFGKGAGERRRSGRPIDPEREARVQRRGKFHRALSHPLVVHAKIAFSEADAAIELEPPAQTPVDLEFERFDVVPCRDAPGNVVER